MGSKDTTSRQTRNQLKCTTCGQLFRTTDALRSHTAKSHSTVLKATATNVKTTTASKADIEKIIQQAEKPKRVIRVSDSMASMATLTVTPNGSIQVKKSLPVEARSQETSSPAELINYSFKCPKCVNKYPSYITAYRHIQSLHCVNKAGLPVEPDSPHLIKPIKFKQCPVCKQESLWNEVHKCKEPNVAVTPKKPVEAAAKSPTPAAVAVAGYLCSGCNQDFEDVRHFDLHIPHSHNVLQALFFSNYREFTKWKTAMEEFTKTTFQMKAQYDEKKYFRCVKMSSCVTHRKKRMMLLCPSVIILQEYMTGIQVHFYKGHANHAFTTYTLPRIYKKHAITNFLKSKEDTTAPVDADLYVHFKTIMESIIMEAAKLDKAHLRMLQGKALGMTMILNNYIVDQADSDDDFSRDDVITEVSDTPEPEPLKEDKTDKAEPVEVKRNVNNVVGKKIVKLVNPDDEIQRIEDVRSSQRLKRRGEDTTPVQKVLPTKRSRRSATVSDSRRDSTPEQEFLQVTTNVTIEATPKPGDKKHDAKKSTPKPKSLKKQTDIEKAIDESNSSPSTTKKVEWFPKSPSFSFADQYKDFVKKNFATTSTETTVKKNTKIRTKLGQFKPSLSPKQRSQSIDSPSPRKSSDLSSPATRATKTANKVKEQENDTNISSSPATRAAKTEKYKANKVKEQENDDSITSSSATRAAKTERYKANKVKEQENDDSITSSSGKRASKTDKNKVKEQENDSKVSSPLATRATKTERYKVQENDTNIARSPPKKAVKIERYEVKEQENDCNILILKI